MEGVHLNYRLFMVTLVILAALHSSYSLPTATTKRFVFIVEWKRVTRLCRTKDLLTVNGEYPGPTIAIHEGDNVEVKVINRVRQNTTIHWHGVKQIRTGWADGPAYITQCPIKGGNSYTYKFTIVNQRGTLLWHAHYSWQRASAYGEWWPDGSGPNCSDAFTINGFPGPLCPCSDKDAFIQTVDHGKTYMLRIINVALSEGLFFSVSNHTLTVVEIDATYTKPFTTTAIMAT